MVQRCIFLDTETTGLSPASGHRVIEIGCVEMIERQITQRTFHVYINPQRKVDEGALAVHGLSDEFLAEKPKFKEIAKDFLDFINGAELIIHNAPFDVGFLNAELEKLKYPKKINEICTVTDTLLMARKMYPGQRNSLDALCKRLGVDNSNRDLHGALLDSQILAQVYIYMTRGQEEIAFVEEEQYKKIEARNYNLPKTTITQLDLQRHKEYLRELSDDDSPQIDW